MRGAHKAPLKGAAGAGTGDRGRGAGDCRALVGTTGGLHGWETEEKAGEEGRWPHAQVQRDRASLGGDAINPKVRLATSVEKRKC